jgi:hypothetical protein
MWPRPTADRAGTRLAADDVVTHIPHAIAVYPAARWIPANILRFHIAFSEPASGAFERSDLHLVGRDGRRIKNAFLNRGEDLWSSDGKRLTVRMMPDLIKRGMGTVAERAPALVPGRRYRLDITTGGVRYSQIFAVNPPKFEPLDERRWFVTRAPAGSSHLLVLLFDRVMDAATVADEVMVVGPDGERIGGRCEITPDGRKMRFHPTRRWRVGEHLILFSRRLEDVCGNRLGKALDHAVSTRQRSRAGRIAFVPPS